MRWHYLISFILISAWTAAAQQFCYSPDAVDTFWGGVGYINLEAESESQPAACMQRLWAPQGQRLVAFQVREQYVANSPICVAATQDFPDWCSSSYFLSVNPGGAGGPGASAFVVAEATTGLGAPSGNWAAIPLADGTLYYRDTTKVYDVSACTATADCELLLEMSTTGAVGNQVHLVEVAYTSYFYIAMTNTPWGFLPMDSSPNAAPSVGSAMDGKTLQVSVGIFNAPFEGIYLDRPIYGTFRFELSRYLGVAGYRPGVSSNMGDAAASEPDFRFETMRNADFDAVGTDGQSIESKDPVDAATAVVSSFDYGGITVLRARVLIGGEWFYAEPPPAVDDEELPLPKATCAVAAGDERPFIQIPIDTDCNWIADSWERGPALQKIGEAHFPHDWDGETTTNPASGVLAGDGYGAYDEYRGFHVVNSSGTAQHRRTDPAKLTSFYHDKSPGAKLQQAFEALLVPQLAGVVEFFRLALDQIKVISDETSESLNRNSEAPLNLRNFPLVLFSRTDHEECQSPEVYGSAFELGKSSKHILFCLSNIEAMAQSGTQLAGTALAVLVAHEVGHRFHLRHYEAEVAHYAGAVQAAAAVQIINSLPASPRVYVESSTDNNVFFARLRYRRAGSAGLFALLPVDVFDYDASYTDSSELRALNGLKEIGVNLLDFDNPPTPNTSELVDAVHEITTQQALATVGSRYQSSARLLTYQRTLIMSYAFLFPIAEANLDQYTMQDLIPKIQLQK